jgi:type III secretory pathway component EscV
MLPALHTQGKLVKVPTDNVEMTPNFQARIKLSELNQIIAEQRGVAIDDLAVRDKNEVTQDNNIEVVEVARVKDLSPAARTTSESVNEDGTTVTNVTVPSPTADATPEAQAKFYRSQADKLAKQAAEMRRKAEELAPTKKAK